MASSAFKQQKQLVYGTLDSRDDLQRAIVQVSSDVKSSEAVCLLYSTRPTLHSSPAPVSVSRRLHHSYHLWIHLIHLYRISSEP